MCFAQFKSPLMFYCSSSAKCIKLVLVLRVVGVPLLHVKVQLSHSSQDHCLLL
jgi:hypothetical protein